MKFNYEFVEEKEFLKRAQTDCLNCLKRLEDLLRNDRDINGQIILIGVLSLFAIIVLACTAEVCVLNKYSEVI